MERDYDFYEEETDSLPEDSSLVPIKANKLVASKRSSDSSGYGDTDYESSYGGYSRDSGMKVQEDHLVTSETDFRLSEAVTTLLLLKQVWNLYWNFLSCRM